MERASTSSCKPEDSTCSGVRVSGHVGRHCAEAAPQASKQQGWNPTGGGKPQRAPEEHFTTSACQPVQPQQQWAARCWSSRLWLFGASAHRAGPCSVHDERFSGPPSGCLNLFWQVRRQASRQCHEVPRYWHAISAVTRQARNWRCTVVRRCWKTTHVSPHLLLHCAAASL